MGELFSGTFCTLYVNSKLTWSDHCKIIASKATKILNVVHRTMFGCSMLAKDVAYKNIVRPSMGYACAVWNPHTVKDCALLDAVQNSGCEMGYEESLGSRILEVD